MNSLRDIVKGFFTFKKQILIQNNERELLKLSKKQTPETLIISCSDSRVDPAILLNADLGEIFVIRNVANIVPPFQEDRSTYHGTSAALEFAVKILQVKNIVVIGHSNCGGIKALLEHDINESNFEHILDWVYILKEAKKKVQDIGPHQDIYHECEKAGIQVSIDNLKTFPLIKERLVSDSLSIYGLYFSIFDMSLEYYNQSTGLFEILEEEGY